LFTYLLMILSPIIVVAGIAIFVHAYLLEYLLNLSKAAKQVLAYSGSLAILILS